MAEEVDAFAAFLASNGDLFHLEIDIYTAAALGDFDVVRDRLADKELDLNRRNLSGWTPLIYAAYSGHDTVVNLLLDDPRVDVNCPAEDGTTALMWAAICGHESVAYFLLQHKAALELSCSQGRTALSYAASKGQKSIVVLLLENGANIEAQPSGSRGATPFLEAVAEGHESVVKVLLDWGANQEAVNKAGQNAVALGLATKKLTIVNLIRAHNTQGSGDDVRSEPGLDGLSAESRGPSASPDLSSSSEYRSSPEIRNGPEALARLTPVSPSGPVPDTDNELCDFLSALGLKKYLGIFEKEEVDFATLVTMDENDLKAIGMKLFGPRRKITTAIQRWHQQRAQQAGEAEELRYLAEQLQRTFDTTVQAQVSTLSNQVAVLSSSLSEAEASRAELREQLTIERQLRSAAETFAGGGEFVATALEDAETLRPTRRHGRQVDTQNQAS